MPRLVRGLYIHGNPVAVTRAWSGERKRQTIDEAVGETTGFVNVQGHERTYFIECREVWCKAVEKPKTSSQWLGVPAGRTSGEFESLVIAERRISNSATQILLLIRNSCDYQ